MENETKKFSSQWAKKYIPMMNEDSQLRRKVTFDFSTSDFVSGVEDITTDLLRITINSINIKSLEKFISTIGNLLYSIENCNISVHVNIDDKLFVLCYEFPNNSINFSNVISQILGEKNV